VRKLWAVAPVTVTLRTAALGLVGALIAGTGPMPATCIKTVWPWSMKPVPTGTRLSAIQADVIAVVWPPLTPTAVESANQPVTSTTTSVEPSRL